LILAAAAGFSCSHSPEDAGSEESAFVPRKPPVGAWSVQGVRIPNSGASRGLQNDPTLGGELLVGPDASLAGPGPLEEALANQPLEPLPEGTALGQNTGPGLTDGVVAPESGTAPDGTPVVPVVPVPRSPYDPALQNPPPTGDGATSGPGGPAAPPSDSGTPGPKVEKP
jgi:hypothetical protein